MEFSTFVNVNVTDTYIGTDRQLYNIIENGCGRDVANLVQDICNENDYETKLAEQKALTEADYYEESLEEITADLQEILYLIQDYKKYDASHKNLNRKLVDKLLENIEDIVNNNI